MALQPLMIILVITSHKLNGDSYFSWSIGDEMYVTGKNKEEYIYRTVYFQ